MGESWRISWVDVEEIAQHLPNNYLIVAALADRLLVAGARRAGLGAHRQAEATARQGGMRSSQPTLVEARPVRRGALGGTVRFRGAPAPRA